MPSNHEYDLILEYLQQRFTQASDVKSVTAGELGLDELAAGAIVLRQRHYQTNGIDWEISLTTPAARPPFEWLAEITAREQPLRHYLLTVAGEVVEAHGKQITPLLLEQATALLQEIQTLS